MDEGFLLSKTWTLLSYIDFVELYRLRRNKSTLSN
jgi:hypothetical protein